MKNNILLNKFLLYNSEGLAYGITEMFSRNLAELLSDKIMIVYPDFDRDSFIQSIENHVVGKTYTRRIPIFASLLKEHLPEDYERALSVLTGIWGEENPNETGMFNHSIGSCLSGNLPKIIVHIETFARQLVCILPVNSLYNRELFRIFEH